MKITNKHRIPKPVVEEVSKPFHFTPGRIGVTTLNSSACIHQLRIRHDDEIVEDAAERMSLLHGNIGHDLLERAALGDPSLEGNQKKLKKTIEMDGWTIVCIGDLYEPEIKRLWDYKFTSVWHVINGIPEDWITQLNCNGYIYRQNGLPVEKLEVFAILDHWSKPKALQGGNYPKRDNKVFRIPIWPDEQVEQYMHERIAAHKAAEKLSDAELPICTSEERWQKKTIYAVTKEGRKTSLRNLDTNTEALSYIEWATNKFNETHGTAAPPAFDIAVRPGEETRCETGKWEDHHWCPVREWCSFYKELQKNK